MPQIYSKTLYPANCPNLLIWDGECGFCKYWKIYLEQYSDDRLSFEPFQEAHKKFPDIEKSRFEKAVFLIDKKGRVYSGANAMFRAFYLIKKMEFFHRWYNAYPFFRKFSEKFYAWVSDHRPFMYKVTTALLGKDPTSFQHKWLIYITILLTIIVLWCFL